MREIKFRGISQATNEMVYGWFRRCGTEDCIFNQNTSSYVISGTVEQYTGLKDKNGEEVYEGDILNFRDCNKCYQSFCEDCEQVVIFLNGSFRFYDNEMPITQEKINRSNYEIIGNIHNEEVDKLSK